MPAIAAVRGRSVIHVRPALEAGATRGSGRGLQPPGEGAHQRRQDRDGADGDGGHDDRRADAHAPDERDPGGEQAGDRDDDDRAGRDDARSRRGVGDARAVLDGVPARELLAVAADDQQRVVDPRAEAEHHAERRGEAREVGEGGAELQQQDAAGQRDQARDQRQQHRGDAAEDEREHEDRDREADQLADRGAHLLGLVDDRAAARDLEAGRARRSPTRLRAVRPGARCRSCAGLSYWTVRKPIRSSRESCSFGDAGDVRLALDGLPGLGDRGVALQRALAREDERRGVAGLRREPLREQVDRLLGLRPGRAEGVDERAAGDRGGRADHDEDDDDDGEGAFPMSRGRGGETSKGMSHDLHGITLCAKMQ